MREIKFRGKRSNNGKWVYGDLTQYSEAISYIITDVIKYEVYQVDAKTVGQYTDRKDKNDKEIFEGDVVRQYEENDYTTDFVIEWYQKRCGFWMKIAKFKEDPRFDLSEFREDLGIIGNIYDNPELLKGGE